MCVLFWSPTWIKCYYFHPKRVEHTSKAPGPAAVLRIIRALQRSTETTYNHPGGAWNSSVLFYCPAADQSASGQRSGTVLVFTSNGAAFYLVDVFHHRATILELHSGRIKTVPGQSVDLLLLTAGDTQCTQK